MLELKMVDFILFSITSSLLFYFLFIFILGVRNREWYNSVLHISYSHMTQSQSHNHMS